MAKKKTKSTKTASRHRCGLCGKTRRLTKTDCCGNWICDDEDKYVLFSFARNSCHRNHDHYTLCAYHHNEKHDGDWKECAECRNSFETEIYVWYGTNEYNFEKLPNPPAYEPTKCAQCASVINLGEDEYSRAAEGYFCGDCSWKRIDRMERGRTKAKRR